MNHRLKEYLILYVWSWLLKLVCIWWLMVSEDYMISASLKPRRKLKLRLSGSVSAPHITPCSTLTAGAQTVRRHSSVFKLVHSRAITANQKCTSSAFSEEELEQEQEVQQELSGGTAIPFKLLASSDEKEKKLICDKFINFWFLVCRVARS